jgi:LmbE family N-acetylglucosaminyl deacetylase
VKLGTGQRALAVGAHPDDAEFGCYGVLQRFDAAAVLVLSAGERGGEPERRRNEAEEAARVVGASITVGSLVDTQIQTTTAVDAVAAAIGEFQPDVVFCPSRHDAHQDHAAAAHACHLATRYFPGLVLCYLTPSAMSRFAPQVVVGLGEAEWETKLRALAAHRSQAHRAYLAPDYLETTFRYWAQQVFPGGGLAEPFELLRWLESP